MMATNTMIVCTINASVRFLQFLRLVFFIGLVCMLTITESSNIKCVDSERRALLNFKKGLVDEYDLLSSWTSRDEDCCRWRGINCDNQTGHVVKLYLQGDSPAHLCGKISPSLLELPYLNHLDLSLNRFTTIPEFIGSLSELTYLDLSYNFGPSVNSITGTIPHQLGNLSKLRHLDLSVNSITGTIPRQLGNLSKLRHLDLSVNYIEGTIPHQLGNLSKLRYLDLSYNDEMRADNLEWLTHLSSLRTLKISRLNLREAVDWLQSFQMLPSLTTLELNGCQFPDQIIHPSLSHVNSSNTSLLPWLFNISTSLVHLSLSHINLEGPLPEYFYNMSSLVHLDLSSNQLVGGIPTSFGNLCSLKTLYVSYNHLSAPLPDLLQNLSAGCTKNSLEILELEKNQLRGSFPEITGFSSLRELYLQDNKLDGTLSKISHHSPNLQVLHLDQNQLKGSLPNLSNFTSLRELHVAKNKLNGAISKVHFLNLSELKELDLSFNSLALNFSSDWIPPFQLVFIKLSSCKLGPWFPSWLQTQLNVTYLDISKSGISDSIPHWFWNFSSKLQYRNISFNNISGEIPNLPLRIPAIDLSHNLFSGPIPLFFSNTLVLNLSNNKFQGSLSFLCTTMLQLLSYLDLSDNLLTGEIPDCWMNFEQLSILNLENNNFSGKIPTSIGSLSWLETLHLRNNNLSGKLPLSLKNCSILKLLDVGENKLSGEVPAWIGDSLPNLIVFRLRSNNFNGSISSNLCHLRSIQILDLSLNNISGTIPPCLSNFSAMVQTEAANEIISTSYMLPDIFWSGFRWNSSLGGQIVDVTSVVWKGVEREYGSTLGLLKVIDISTNQLIGKIPEEVTSLLGLMTLNLSRNNLVGTIPKKTGELKRLESLDLSRNQLSGEIPASLADSSVISYLDLSSNNLSGRIPTSTQLQSFNASSYMGNSDLCGPPLKKCPGDETIQDSPNTRGSENNIQGGEWFDKSWMYSGMGAGFFTGFGVVFGTMLFCSNWRHAYFQFLNNMVDWLCLTIALKVAKLQRKFQR